MARPARELTKPQLRYMIKECKKMYSYTGKDLFRNQCTVYEAELKSRSGKSKKRFI